MNIGMVRVNASYLARVLGYKGADVRQVKLLCSEGVNIIEVVLEHPSFSNIIDGNVVTVLDTIYVREQ